MNFNVSKYKFYDALSIVNRAISANNPIPSLSGIMIEAKDDSLILTGSDSNVSIRAVLSNAQDNDLNLSITENGRIVIDSRYLLEIVRKIDSDSINIEIIDGNLVHFGGLKAEYKINGFRPEDYPDIDFSEPSISFQLSADLFSEMIQETFFAASSKETRPVLMGVNMKEEGGMLICTATDSYRLARKIIQINADPFAVTVPAKILNEARSIFTNGEIEFFVSNRKIQMKSGGITLQSTLLEGAYPETNRLIPSEFSYSLVINRQSLIQAIDRTNFIKTDNMSIIRLQINSKDDIIISNKNQEIGEFHEALIAESYEGEPLDISFAGNYVESAAKVLSTDNIKIQFTGEMKPFVLTNEGGDNSILQLVLPVRTYN